ncbi:hypothetical protein HPB51_008557 [Rhipicephalus microplus]|uniref:Endonuclease/exonuclease/phosphatase domain-containing protein n=1 Tax=Rhipicephalus microplus TaxID=6941 RepID=A0A9J6D4N5_RHIMP|nr:hypothetical protein HPB51_008557 [Rhipicephalus microplus]
MTSTQDAHPERQEVKPSDTRSRSTSPTSKRRGYRSRSKQRRKNQPQNLRLGSAAPEAPDAPPPSAAATQSHSRHPYGDFHAPSPAWGYTHDTRKGRLLWQDTHNLGYTLIKDPAYPTWFGNSIARDTTPDLTFTANITHAEWSNLFEHLGSDHYIIQTIVKAGPQRRESKQPALVDWDVFHELRATASPESATSIDEWTASLLRDVKRATKTPPEDAVVDAVDTKLLHMWDALAGLRKRYNYNKFNRLLRKRIAILTRQIEDYALQLSRQNWHQLLNVMERLRNVPKTWNILRRMIEPTSRKTAQRHSLITILHNYPGTNQDLI